MMSELLRMRVRERLDALAMNPFEAARRAGLKRGYINDLLIGKKTTVREKSIPALATALECAPDYLLGRAQTPLNDTEPIGMHLSGIAELGAWREPGTDSLPDTPIPMSPDPRYPREQQRAYIVRGDHAGGLGINDGSVVCVLLCGGGFRDGDLVLIRRVRGDEAEISIRVIQGGQAIARPLKGPAQGISAGAVEIVGLIVNSLRIFGLPN